ncbi:MAG: phosphodiesterase [Gammaproteobacteria bacterium]|nr:phosphodiesterase [Gammaproteobacteria bacterium]
MNTVYRMLCGLAVSLALAGPAAADTLLVESVQAAKATAAERPTRGLSMDSVEARWGAPVSRSDAVGQPPITRWEYPSFFVYFEYQHVIDSVRR